MEAIEIVVYFAIAVIVAGLMLGFLMGWDYRKPYAAFKRLMTGDETERFAKVDRYEFAGRLYEFFQDCVSRDENMSLSLYLKENGTFTKKELFDVYKEFGWCDTVQSAAYACGTREDLTMGSLTLPRVVTISCSNYTLKVS
jgi:hypothetical protein